MDTTTETDLEPKLRTITLTDRTPVAIFEDEWPELAGANYDVSEPRRRLKGWIKVRRHPDGRTLIYGGVSLGTTVPDEHGYLHRGGEILSPHTEPSAAVNRLAADLFTRSGQERIRDMGRFTLAKLPAEVL